MLTYREVIALRDKLEDDEIDVESAQAEYLPRVNMVV